MTRFLSTKIIKTLGLPTIPEPGRFYLVESLGTIKLYLSSTDGELILLGNNLDLVTDAGGVLFYESGVLNTDASFTYNSGTQTLSVGSVSVDDDAYGISWDGDFSVPTKNSLFDAISSLPFGEANTASNVGSGTGIFKTKVGVDLQFKSIANTATATLSSLDANTLQIDVLPAGLDINDLGGTPLDLDKGGTGAALTDPGADRIMFWDDSAGVVTWLSAGTGLSITGTTIDASATVSSVGLSLPAIFSVSGSPVTGSGTLSATLANQLQNLIFASPDGSTGTPSFRALVAADIPNLDTAKITSGTIGTARLGSGTANSTTFLRGDSTWQTISGLAIGSSITSVGNNRFLISDGSGALDDLDNVRVYSVSRTLPTTVGNEVHIGQFTLAFGAANFDIWITVSGTGFAVTKRYYFSHQYNGLSVWKKVNAVSSTGAYSGNDFDLEINSSGGANPDFRLRRVGGTTSGTALVTIIHQGSTSDSFTSSTSTSVASAPTTVYESPADLLLGYRVQIGTTPVDSGSFSLTSWNSSGYAISAIKSPSHNGGSTPAAGQPALVLMREGFAGQSYANFAELKISRYENAAGAAARTQLDFALTHGSGDATGTNILSLRSAGFVGINTNTPEVPLDIIKTTEQVRIRYDASNYLKLTVASTGSATFDLVAGSGTPKFIFSDGVEPASMADAAAANNSIYYSTTQSKLVYKDGAGVVNNLY